MLNLCDIKYAPLLVLLFLFEACGTLPRYNKLEITPLFEKENIGVRALEIHHRKVFFAGREGWVGIYDLDKKSIETTQWENHEYRAIGVSYAAENPMLFLINVGSPAYLFSGDDIYNLKRQLISNHPNAFFDALVINDYMRGIAIGDPTDSCMSYLTFDPNSNQLLGCEQFPKTFPGEAAFAASNTNIKIIDNNIWFASGGKKSRIFKSIDYGQTWQSFETPIIQGKKTTGIYSIDFYNQNLGIAIGGDYTMPEDNVNNLIKTIDGGVTWRVLNHPSHPGYRSCIQFVPNSKGKMVVSVGFQGIDISYDAGETWQKLSDQSVYTIRFLNEKTAFAAGKNGVYRLDFLE